MTRKRDATWQLRLGRDEDEIAAKLADRQRSSKNAVVNQILRLAGRIEIEQSRGARLLIERVGPDGVTNVVELWLLI